MSVLRRDLKSSKSQFEEKSHEKSQETFGTLIEKASMCARWLPKDSAAPYSVSLHLEISYSWVSTGNIYKIHDAKPMIHTVQGDAKWGKATQDDVQPNKAGQAKAWQIKTS